MYIKIPRLSLRVRNTDAWWHANTPYFLTPNNSRIVTKTRNTPNERRTILCCKDKDEVSSVLPVDEVVDADIAHSCFHFAVHLLHIT